MLNFPLMVVPLALYNLIAFGLLSSYLAADWETVLFQFAIPSGASWQFTLGDLFILSTLVLLFIELLKATRIGQMRLWEHVLSTLVFFAFVAEFLFVKEAATTLFFILMAIAFIDVITSIVISRHSANHSIDIEDLMDV